MVKEGYYFGLPPLVAGVIAFFSDWRVTAIVFVCLAAFIFYFFRDPDRVIPSDPDAVGSPAAGRVVVDTDEANAGRPGKPLIIFLQLSRVPVNRSPAAGIISKMEYRPGKFLVAMRERASTENEQNIIPLSTETGEMMSKQIAGI